MLVHGMLDYVVDGYFEITQDFDDVIEDLEDEVLEQTAGSRDLQRRIYRLRLRWCTCGGPCADARGRGVHHAAPSRGLRGRDA